MAIDIQEIINKKTNHLLELLKQKKDVVKEEPLNEEPMKEEFDEVNDIPMFIEEKTPMTDIVLQKIEKILELLREKKNKNENVKTLVETSLSVLLDVLNNQGKQTETFTELATAILNDVDIDKPVEDNNTPISSEKIPVIADLALELYSSILDIVEDNIARDEIKKAIEFIEVLKPQDIAINNVEQLVDISTKILEEISNTISQSPSGKVVEPSVEPQIEPRVEPTILPIATSTYYNSMIKKNSDMGTFLAAAIGNALVNKKPSMIDNILSGLTKTGTVFKNVFKGIDMNDMKTRLSNLNIPKGATSNVKLSLPATNDIFRLTIGYPLAFIKYCAEKGIKIPQDMIDNFKQNIANVLDENAGKKPVEETRTQDAAESKQRESETDTPQKEVNCSDPRTLKLGQIEDTALCFDPKENKVIAAK